MKTAKEIRRAITTSGAFLSLSSLLHSYLFTPDTMQPSNTDWQTSDLS